MDAQIQTYLALAVVGVTVAGLVWRWLGKSKGSGCGGDCGCASADLKAKLKR
ncbi:MAG: FeoB-associated Cys-rich membrane protein [Opitutaceae bacterium]